MFNPRIERRLTLIGIWIGAAGLTVLAGMDGIGDRSRYSGNRHLSTRSDTRMEPESNCHTWSGLNLVKALEPFRTLHGEGVRVEDSSLRLWILIQDRECISCLQELPLLDSFIDSLCIEELDAVIVAIGDLHESRRILWGVETGIPVLISDRKDFLGLISRGSTPLRVLTLQNRIVGLCRLPIHDSRGRSKLLDLIQKWSAQ